ncbi:MAG TPA: enolase C-terminal domain-like protein [Bryobacteraceae bacterium]|nr:enolase C-terminal domain-like protein [Bryobacteraceae bacterium]
MARDWEVPVERLDVSAFTIPTSSPEADGTLAWNETTVVIVTAGAGGEVGLGYTYADVATARLIECKLKRLVLHKSAVDVTAAWSEMVRAIRNLGRPGIASMGIAAVDNALWDLKARLFQAPLVTLLGQVRESAPVYGSGGFTTYSAAELMCQLHGWVTQGIGAVKMKVGSHPEQDLDRVKTAREAIGPAVRLMVDANGAYSRKQALGLAEKFRDLGVSWFEEPVSSDDLEGLRLLRDRAPAEMEIAAGEYGYDAVYFRRMLEAGAVDVLQADATRCAGATGFLEANSLCQAFGLPLSAHTAPSLHAHLCCAALRARDVEYFHDHVRIEQMLFDGAAKAEQGVLKPDLSRPGFGLELKHQDVERFRVYGNAAAQRSRN